MLLKLYLRTTENRLLKERVKGVLNFLERVRSGLNAKLNGIEAALYNPNDCHITVSGVTYPGTVLKHRDKIIPINEAVKGKRWLFSPPEPLSGRDESASF